MYRGDSVRKDDNVSLDPIEDTDPGPFVALYKLAQRLEKLFIDLESAHPECEFRFLKLSHDIGNICDTDADAAIGAVHLCHDGLYTTCHPINIAILTELLARRLNYSADERGKIVAAALTANIGMRQIQVVLQKQSEPLTSYQKHKINSHPVDSFAILQKAKINDPLWLKTVLQHHERVDGSGYPKPERP